MEAQVSKWWPDLHLCPINLWSAPWVGRKYTPVVPDEFEYLKKEVAIPKQSM